MSDDVRAGLEHDLSQSPMDWELRLAVIREYVARGDMDGAKRFVRESPEEAGPVPAHVQHRLYQMMTEGGSIAVGLQERPPGELALELPPGENAMHRPDGVAKQRALERSGFVLAGLDDVLPRQAEATAGQKVSALTFALVVHLGLVVLLGFISISMPRPNPPQIVAVNTVQEQEADLASKRIDKIRRPQGPAPSVPAAVVVGSRSSAPVFVPDFDLADDGALPAAMVGFSTGFGSRSAGSGAGGGGGGGSIGGMKIKSRRLGVILDVSGSMDEQIRAVRREIRKHFSSASVVEVVGCSLDWSGEDPGFDLEKARGRVRMEKNADSVVAAVEILIAAGKVDAIFWFSDLQDSQSEAGLQRLSHLLGTNFGSERRPVKFYVQSVGRDPSARLAGIAKRSGGATKVDSFE